MAMNAAQIAQELEALEAQNRACAKQLRELYRRYLAELSNTASQQLMTVCYQLCTESYPEAFLSLSSHDRQRLQEQVKDQGEKLRQQLSLEELLQPDPGDVEDASQPRIAVIQAELTGDDLEVLTSALDENNSERVLALLRDKDIDLPFDLEAVMQQRLKSKAGDSGESKPVAEGSDSDTSERLQPPDEAVQSDGASDGDSEREPTAEDEDRTDSSALAGGPVLAEEAPSAKSVAPAEQSGDGEAHQPPLVEAANLDDAAASGDTTAPAAQPVSAGGRSLGRRFLEDILSRRTLDRRKAEEDGIANVAGEGSLRIESEAQGLAETASDRATQTEDSQENAQAGVAASANPDEPDLDNRFADNNGFDPDFEPPPAEDRYEPTPLKSSEKLDISPGVLASTLAAEGDDARRGMLTRPTAYDGTTEMSDEALRNPLALIRWVERMERGISQRLRQSSQRMTRRLEKSAILNNELPDGLLEAAVRPDGDHENDSDGNMPHVLRLKLNAAGKEGRARKDKSIRIVAIYLRLSEIEFATPGVMAWRNQLRSQVKQLRRLSKAYQECKHAQNVVKAQEIWRSGWMKD